MANEAVKVEGPYETHDFTVASGTQISAMTLMVFSDPRTAAASTGDNSSPVAGVSMIEKDATDANQTNLGIASTGTFLMKTDTPGCVAGELVTVSGTNLVTPATALDILSGTVLGKALEDIAAGTTGEVKLGVGI